MDHGYKIFKMNNNNNNNLYHPLHPPPPPPQSEVDVRSDNDAAKIHVQLHVAIGTHMFSFMKVCSCKMVHSESVFMSSVSSSSKS